MSKHHIENLAEQITNKVHGSTPSHQQKKHSQPSEAENSGNIQVNGAEDDSSIKLRAYQIHLEKGGSVLDNWLEAEQSIKKEIKLV
jgi:hypothetical protein